MKKERQKCEIWSRVMGYMRPFSFYNLGKQSEFKERKCFKEPDNVLMFNETFKDKYDK